MKTIRMFLILFLVGTTIAGAQEITEKEAKKAARSEYSRWSIGANFGVPFTYGDMSSFAESKTYLGAIGGLQATYQLSPTFGLSLIGEYGANKAGNKAWEHNFVLSPDGSIVPFYLATPGSGNMKFSDLYVQERHFVAGLHLDVNLFNLFAGQRYNPGRFTIIASPGIYAQKFSPTVHQLSNGEQFAAKLPNDIGLGLGGNLTFRYRASRVVDFQLKTNMQWVTNQNFDGIINTAEREMNSYRYTWMASTMVGVVFKLGGKKKKENLIWSTNRYTMPVQQSAPAEPAPKATPAPAPSAAAPAPAPVYETIVVPELPAIHFPRDVYAIDKTKYKAELDNILSVLNEYKELAFTIQGFADHSGSTSVNDKISRQRAEALRDYLIESGISSNRIKEVKGYGIDKSFSGKEAFSIKARRAVVITLEKDIKRLVRP